MMTHTGTRAISGNCVSPWPCDLQQRAASIASPHQTPLPSPQEKQLSPVLLWISKTLAIQTGWCYGGSRHSWLWAIWGYVSSTPGWDQS